MTHAEKSQLLIDNRCYGIVALRLEQLAKLHQAAKQLCAIVSRVSPEPMELMKTWLEVQEAVRFAEGK